MNNPKSELDLARDLVSRFPLVAADLSASTPSVASFHSTSGFSFSGARLWQVRAGETTYCLRRWPNEHPSRPRLQFIHDVLHHVAQSGIDFVPYPLRDSRGTSILESDGSFWELTHWMPGEADFNSPPPLEKVRSAFGSVAQFHLAAATFGDQRTSLSQGIQERLRQLGELQSGLVRRLAAAVVERDCPSLAYLAKRFLALLPQTLGTVQQRLQNVSHYEVPQQPCIRDIWRAHVLFEGSRVTGLIDFGAMRMDNVSCDVARLLGSLAGDDPSLRTAAIKNYEEIRPLSNAERELLLAFDQSSIVLGGVNWLRWIYLDGRVFNERAKVEMRLAEHVHRLEYLASQSLKGLTLPG